MVWQASERKKMKTQYSFEIYFMKMIKCDKSGKCGAYLLKEINELSIECFNELNWITEQQHRI